MFKAKADKINAEISAASRRVEDLAARSGTATLSEIVEFFEDVSAGAMTDEQIISAFVGQVAFDGVQAVAVMNFDSRPAERYEIEWVLKGVQKSTNPSSRRGFVPFCVWLPG